MYIVYLSAFILLQKSDIFAIKVSQWWNKHLHNWLVVMWKVRSSYKVEHCPRVTLVFYFLQPKPACALLMASLGTPPINPLKQDPNPKNLPLPT